MEASVSSHGRDGSGTSAMSQTGQMNTKEEVNADNLQLFESSDSGDNSGEDSASTHGDDDDDDDEDDDDEEEDDEDDDDDDDDDDDGDASDSEEAEHKATSLLTNSDGPSSEIDKFLQGPLILSPASSPVKRNLQDPDPYWNLAFKRRHKSHGVLVNLVLAPRNEDPVIREIRRARQNRSRILKHIGRDNSYEENDSRNGTPTVLSTSGPAADVKGENMSLRDNDDSQEHLEPQVKLELEENSEVRDGEEGDDLADYYGYEDDFYDNGDNYDRIDSSYIKEEDEEEGERLELQLDNLDDLGDSGSENYGEDGIEKCNIDGVVEQGDVDPPDKGADPGVQSKHEKKPSGRKKRESATPVIKFEVDEEGIALARDSSGVAGIIVGEDNFLKKMYRCTLCQFVGAKRQWLDHLKSQEHSDVGIVFCEATKTCNLAFLSQEAKDRHCSESHPGDNVRKKRKSKKFELPQPEEEAFLGDPERGLAGAVLSGSGGTDRHRNFACIYGCEFSGRKKVWMKHLAEVHADKTFYYCRQNTRCNLPFETEEDLVRHERLGHGLVKPPHQCPQCWQQFKYKVTMHSHALREHGLKLSEKRVQRRKGEGDEDLPPPQPPVCSYCNKTFASMSGLRSHEAHMHTGDLRFACVMPDCDKRFFNRAELVVHERTHKGELPFVCSFCGARFVARTRLMQHEKYMHRSSPDEKYAECPICRKRIRKKNLPAHIRSLHEGLNRVACSSCGKEFPSGSALKRHEMIHSGEKRFACSYCGKAFVQKANMLAHERTHTGEKPYACAHCGESFTQGTRRNQHQISCRLRPQQPPPQPHQQPPPHQPPPHQPPPHLQQQPQPQRQDEPPGQYA